ncbi:MAG: SRPBCC family protein [Vicinamibacteria bacterium]
MSSFSTEIRIDASVDRVWATLADIGTIDRWNPGIVGSRLTTDMPAGVGARRYCDLGRRMYLREEVIEWEPGERLTMRVVDTNLPIRAADIRFTLIPNRDGTIVRVSPEYALKFGLLGRALDRVYVRGVYEDGMKALLSGLKQYVERDR